MDNGTTTGFTMNGQPGYELIMPFLPVRSNGGPYDDTAYAAGFEMGALDGLLAAVTRATGGTHGPYEVSIHAQNRDQADLVAMRYGYVCEPCGEGYGWIRLRLQQGSRP